MPTTRGWLAILGLTAGGVYLARRKPTAAAQVGALGDEALHPPLPGDLTIRSRFGVRKDPKTGAPRKHQGIDIATPIGTPVSAPADGTVTALYKDGVGPGASEGNAVILDTDDHSWAFMHLSKISVKVGDQIRRGQLLGLSGNTGRSTGSHLHIQVWNDSDQPVDPETVYPAVLFTNPRPAQVASR